MVRAKTKYFGEILANEEDNEIVILTRINVTGREQEISVLMEIEKTSKTMDICVNILDDYKRIYENGKKILEAEYHKNNGMKDFLHELLEKYGEEKFFEIFGVKNIVGRKINELIENLDGPNISLEVKDGKEDICLVYGLNNEIEEMMAIKINRKYEMEDIEYYH